MDRKTRQLMEQIVTTPVQPQSEKIRGVGDVVAKMTKAVGVKACEPCEKRRQWLNKRFPIGR